MGLPERVELSTLVERRLAAAGNSASPALEAWSAETLRRSAKTKNNPKFENRLKEFPVGGGTLITDALTDRLCQAYEQRHGVRDGDIFYSARFQSQRRSPPNFKLSDVSS